MRFYADRPARRTRQIVADLAVLAWVALWYRLARALHGLIDELAEPGRRAEDAGTGLARGLGDAGRRASDVPLVGDALRQPFDQAQGAAQGLASAGQQLQDIVHRVADVAALSTFAVPVLVALLLYLPLRLLWVRDASAVTRLGRRADGYDALALRAVARARPHRLLRLPEGTVRAFLDGDPSATARLAALEMGDLGLSGPSPVGARRME